MQFAVKGDVQTDLFSHCNRLRHFHITHERPGVTGNSDEELCRSADDKRACHSEQREESGFLLTL